MKVTTVCFVFFWLNVPIALGSSLSSLFVSNAPSVVSLVATDKFGNEINKGTGFFLIEGCHVATAYHVVKGASSVKIVSDSTDELIVLDSYIADKTFDLAIIQVNDCGIPLNLADGLPSIGDEVFTISHPRGLKNTLSGGLISGIRDGNILQTSTPVAVGSSGAPLINMDGAVVGLISFNMFGSQNLNFAVSAQQLNDIYYANKRISHEEFTNNIRANPLTTASAFFWAIHQQNVNAATAFVSPPDQESFKNAFDTFRPSIASDAALSVSFGLPRDGNPHAEVSVDGTTVGVDLVLYNKVWWIVK